ncbi:hypothetical protein ACFLXQ_06920 [Chloroflexota bacterium]
MKHKSGNIVIGICSPSGGGKTSLVKKLSELIEDNVTISFDDYGDPFWDIMNFEKWIRQGADLNKITTTKLATDLEALRTGKSIISPNNQEVIEPRKFILFDTLVGRSQNATGKFIDFLVYIDVPLELALSRRIMRSLSEVPTDKLNIEKTRGRIEKLNEYLAAYSGQTGPRQIYLAIQNQVKTLSDVVLNGERPISSLATDVLAALNYEPEGGNLLNQRNTVK